VVAGSIEAANRGRSERFDGQAFQFFIRRFGRAGLDVEVHVCGESDAIPPTALRGGR
jgi:hypothetical protein